MLKLDEIQPQIQQLRAMVPIISISNTTPADKNPALTFQCQWPQRASNTNSTDGFTLLDLVPFCGKLNNLRNNYCSVNTLGWPKNKAT